MAMVCTQSLSLVVSRKLERPHSFAVASSSSSTATHFSHLTPIYSLSSSPLINHLKLNQKGTRNENNYVTTTRASSLSGSAYSDDGIADMVRDVTIFTASGEPVLVRDLWDQKQGMAVLVLLRHFGCPCCWELASALKDSKQRFDSAGVKLIAVGVGTPNKAQLLAERLPFPLDCLYCDPNRELYNVLGLYYGLARTFFNPASAKVLSRFDSLREAVRNYTIEATPDDRSGVLQQGGMFVFKGSTLLYSRKDEGTGDHAPLNEILDICCTSSVKV